MSEGIAMSTEREEMAAKARAKHEHKAKGRVKAVVEKVQEVAGKAVDAVKNAAGKGKKAPVPPKAT